MSITVSYVAGSWLPSITPSGEEQTRYMRLNWSGEGKNFFVCSIQEKFDDLAKTNNGLANQLKVWENSMLFP
jgi:hypothetical protein